MKRFGYIAILAALPTVAIAQNKGIEHTNYVVAIGRSSSDIGSSSTLFGQIRLPVFDYTGVSLGGAFSNFSGSDNFVDSRSKAAFVSVFLRDYDIGIIQANFVRGISESDAPFNTSSSNQFTLDGSYYIKDIDLSLSRSMSKSSDGNTYHFSSLDIRYYINDNLAASISTFGMTDSHPYFIGISYQPTIFDKSISVDLMYSKSDFDKSLGVAFVYYFDTKVSIIERVRKY